MIVGPTFFSSPAGAASITGVAYDHEGSAPSDPTDVPPHSAGDLIVVVGMAQSAGDAPPATPAGWTSILSEAGTGIIFAWRAIYKVDSDNTVGTITFGYTNHIHVYGGAGGIGAAAKNGETGPGTTATIPSLTLNISDGSSWVMTYAQNNQGLAMSVPSGMTLRTDASHADTHDSNGGLASYAGGTVTWSSSGYWTTAAIEVTKA